MYLYLGARIEVIRLYWPLSGAANGSQWEPAISTTQQQYSVCPDKEREKERERERERERATRNETICCAKLPIGRQATACQIMQRHQSSVSTFAFDIEALRQRKVMKSWLSVVVVVVGACVESCSECYASVIVSRQIFSFVLSF